MKDWSWCHHLALFLPLVINLAPRAAVAAVGGSNGRRRGLGGGTGSSFTTTSPLMNGNEENQELCSVLLSKHGKAPSKKSKNECPGNNTELEEIRTRMDEGIRAMNLQKGGDDRVFVLGTSGAGKSTIALLLINISSLHSCKDDPLSSRYRIQDVKGKISVLSSQSKTKVPEIIHSPDHGTTFYDCPGFDDSCPTDELTNAYFIKHALDTSKRLKFLLVVPADVLRIGGSRHSFTNLLLHVVRTVTKIEKFAYSFAMAVTFGDPYLTANETVNEAAGFLKGFLQKELETVLEGTILTRARALLNSLLFKVDYTYAAIGAFRQPTRYGPLSDMRSAREDRELLLRVLNEDTEYEGGDPQDFGYSVSDSAKLRAVGLVSKIDDKIQLNVQSFWAYIRGHYETELNQLIDPVEHQNAIEPKIQLLSRVRGFFQDWHLSRNSTWAKLVEEFAVKIMGIMAPLKLDLLDNPMLASVVLQGSHLTFVQRLIRGSVELQWTRWLSGMEDVVQFLEMYRDWAITLNQLEGALGTHQVQKLSYCLPEFRSESGLINATAGRVEAFMAKRDLVAPHIYNIITTPLRPFVDGSKYGVGKTMVNFLQLNPILEYFFGRKCDTAVCRADGNTATISGNFILASKLRARENSNCISQSTKKVIIYAWDTFFLDADINGSLTANHTFDLVIIANRLKSSGDKIDLSGRDGPNYQEATAAVPGGHGLEGANGQNGGNFFGLFGQDSVKILVQSNGGRGGDGQNGGAGLTGKNGTFVETTDLDHRIKLKMSTGFWHRSCVIESKASSLLYEAYQAYQNYDEKKCWQRVDKKAVIVFSGDPAISGKRGGNGGAAGQGGQPGAGKYYTVSHNGTLKSLKIMARAGLLGTPGQGGRGGKGGMSRNVIACLEEEGGGNVAGHGTMMHSPGDCALTKRKYSLHYTSDGSEGNPGGHPRSPVPNPPFNPYDYTQNVIGYKERARDQLRSGSAGRRILPFLRQLEVNRGVNVEFFQPKQLVADVVSLEEQLPSLLKHNKTNLVFFYDALLTRTIKMLARPHQTEQERTALRQVATVAHGRILALLSKKNARSNLIIDLEGYIDLTTQTLLNVKQIQASSNSANRITATKQKYDQFIQSRIAEVDDMIRKVIEPEIAKVQDDMDAAMGVMIEQLIDERRKAVDARNDLYAYEQRLRGALMTRKFFGFLNMGGQALSFLGPKGAIAGAVISTVSSVAQSFVGSDAGPSASSLAQLQDKALSWYLKTSEQTLSDNEKQLRDLKERVELALADDPNLWPDKFREDQQKISSELSKVDDLTNGIKMVKSLDLPGGGGVGVIETLENEAQSIKTQVRTKLEAMEKSLQQTISGKESRNARLRLRTENSLRTTQTFLGVLNSGVEMYKLFKHNDSMLQELAKAEKVVKGYDTKIKSVDERMPQALDKLREISAAAFKSVRNESSASPAQLDVSSWKLQSALDDVIFEMETQVLAGVEVDAQIKASLKKLKAGFGTLFKVCDRIQNYVAEQRMATLFADSILSTVEVTSLRQDPELYTNVRKLQLVSQSNFVLNLWQNIEESFRMYVFPYAGAYLSQIPMLEGEQDLLLLPQNVTDLPTLVTEISRRTGELKTKLALLRTTIDPDLHTNEREGGFDLSNPFYIWTAEEIKSILPDILNGSSVNLMADVRQSPVPFDAVKFNATHLHLIHANATVNSALQSALRAFELSMTHTGVNNYRFDGKYYRIYSGPLNFQVSYKMGQNQHKNKNYVKLGQGPALLSPFTLWNFQLNASSAGVTMEQLRRFIGQPISLVLTGYGTYVTNSAGQSAERLVDRFYESVQL